jgi:hypothetical protein
MDDVVRFWALHWIFFAVAIAVFLYPIGRILTRLGYSPYWCSAFVGSLVGRFAVYLRLFGAGPLRYWHFAFVAITIVLAAVELW